MGILGLTFLVFFFPFSPASLTKSWLFWYDLKDLFTLHKLDETGGHMDPHWRLQAVQGRMGYLNTLLRNFFLPDFAFYFTFCFMPKSGFS